MKQFSIREKIKLVGLFNENFSNCIEIFVELGGVERELLQQF